jgi:hypothetical protein
LKRRVNTQDAENSRKSYREDTLSGSEVVSVSNSTDDDFDKQTARKRQKLNPSLRNQSPGHEPGSKAPRKTAKVHIEQSNIVPTRGPTALKAPPRKRKISTEVVDLSGLSPPPPKRRAIESAIVEDTIVSRVPMIDPIHARPNPPTSSVPDDHTQTSHSIEAQDSVSALTQHTASVQTQAAAFVRDQDSPFPSTEYSDLVNMVKDTTRLVAALMREQVLTGFDISEELEARLKCIRRTIERDSGELLHKMLQDIHSADSAKAEMRQLIHDLVGHRVFGRPNTFPRYVDPFDINRAWKKLRQHIHQSFGFDEPNSEPNGFDAGYIAARIDDLSKNCRDSELGVPKHFLEELAPHVTSTLSAQAVVAALVCRWLFAEPEWMCRDVYSPKETKLYEALLVNRESLSIGTSYSSR